MTFVLHYVSQVTVKGNYIQNESQWHTRPELLAHATT
jgi:hypothetical protein